jgi:hypothetical protein
MSTYKRATGNIVFETLAANSSVSFIGPTANAVSVVINGDLSVSGNASLTGNIAGDKIFNGTTSIEIPVANGNANVSVGGVSNVLVVASNGINVAGNANVTGNAVIGNLQVNGVIAGNVSFGNLDTTGNVSITRDASLGQPTFRFNDTDTTLSVSTVLGAVEWFTSDTTPGARVTTAVRSIATSATGNARYEVLTSTNGAAATAKFVIDDVGNVGVANTAPLHTFAVSGNTYVSGTETVIGNITGGNFITAGLVSSTGNITSAGNIAGGNLAITANVTANNLSATTGISAGVGGVTATGNIRGGNLVSDGVISATGNLTTTDIFATTLSASGNITGANLNVGGVANTNSVTAVTTVSAGGNVTGGNVNTAGLVSATGNVTGGNISAPGRISAAGNVVAGAFFVGDGGFISNITIASNVAVTQLANGTSNWTIRGAGGNITGDVAGVANVVIITTNTMSVTGSMSATGNVTGGNITTVGLVSATGNIDGGNVNATIGNFNTVIGVANASNLTTGTVPSDRLTGIYAINVSGYSATVSAAAQPNITSVGTLTSLSVSGNITGGNLILSGAIVDSAQLDIQTSAANANIVLTPNGTGNTNIGRMSASGNITAAAFYGPLVGAVSSGTTVSATGNITGGNIITAGIVSATGNVTGNYIFGNGACLTGVITSVANINNGTSNVSITTANANVTFAVNGTANVLVVANTGAYVTGLISAQSNVIAGGNVNATGVVNANSVTATGNVVAGNVITSGSGGNITGANVITATTLSAVANVTASTYFGSGAGLTSIPGGNVTGTVSSATTAGTVTTAAQPNITSVGTLTALSVSTGNITAGNLLISGAIIDSAQLDIQTSAANANIILTPNGTGNVNIGRMSASGNITAVAFYGNGAGLTSLAGGNVTGTVANATYATSAGSAGSATTAGTVTANAQSNITSVGTLGSLAVTANITSGNLSVSTGTITVGNIVNANGNGVGNIGSSSLYFNTVFAKATSAQYADLAEKFLADQPYVPGTVLIFGGNKEVTISTTDADHRVAGVVSTDPSYLMNSGLTGDYAVELALQGRVPCKVVGPVEKGDLLVSATDGHARAVKSASAGTIIGKSLQNFHGTTGVIEIVVGRD